MSTTKKRPAPLNLADTKCVPGTLQTPKNLAQDITMQCLSPTLPRGISVEMLKRTQEIEAQQRQIIVQRGLCAYTVRVTGDADADDDDLKSHTSTPTSANTSSSGSVPSVMVEGEAIPPHRPNRSVPASATSTTYSRRPWELGKESTVPETTSESKDMVVDDDEANETDTEGDSEESELPTSAPESATITSPATSTLRERRGAKPISLDVNALRPEDGDPESRAIDEDDEMPSLPSMHQYLNGLKVGKKRKFMELCSEMWELFHS